MTDQPLPRIPADYPVATCRRCREQCYPCQWCGCDPRLQVSYLPLPEPELSPPELEIPEPEPSPDFPC